MCSLKATACFLFHFYISFSCCYLGTEREKKILLQMSHKWQLSTLAVIEHVIQMLTLQQSK